MHIVTGMHRSGTSFISQSLHWLGADFGDPESFFPADHWNKSGYFENIDIIDINNKSILGASAKIDYWLNAPKNTFIRLINSALSMKWKYLYFPSIQGINTRGELWQSQMQSIHELYKGKYVKDPRFCLTIKSWGNFGAIESITFIFRNPASVAGSVKRREGLPLSFGYKYWIYHIENFLKHAPKDTPLFIYNFDNFFSTDNQKSEFDRLASMQGITFNDERALSLPSQLKINERTQNNSHLKMPKHVLNYYEILNELHESSSSGPIYLRNFQHLF